MVFWETMANAAKFSILEVWVYTCGSTEYEFRRWLMYPKRFFGKYLVASSVRKVVVCKGTLKPLH